MIDFKLCGRVLVRDRWTDIIVESLSRLIKLYELDKGRYVGVSHSSLKIVFNKFLQTTIEGNIS